MMLNLSASRQHWLSSTICLIDYKSLLLLMVQISGKYQLIAAYPINIHIIEHTDPFRLSLTIYSLICLILKSTHDSTENNMFFSKFHPNNVVKLNWRGCCCMV